MIIRAAAIMFDRSRLLAASRSLERLWTAEMRSGAESSRTRSIPPAIAPFLPLMLCHMDNVMVIALPIANNPIVARDPPVNAISSPAATASIVRFGATPARKRASAG